MRPDLGVVAGLVPRGSRVLDLGCGEGDLLSHLEHERGCTGTGVEIEESAILAAIRAGVAPCPISNITSCAKAICASPSPS